MGKRKECGNARCNRLVIVLDKCYGALSLWIFMQEVLVRRDVKSESYFYEINIRIRNLRILSVNAERNILVKHFSGLSVENQWLHQMFVTWEQKSGKKSSTQQTYFETYSSNYLRACELCKQDNQFRCYVTLNNYFLRELLSKSHSGHFRAKVVDASSSIAIALVAYGRRNAIPQLLPSRKISSSRSCIDSRPWLDDWIKL